MWRPRVRGMRPAPPSPWGPRRLEGEPRNNSSILRLPRGTQTRALQHFSGDAAASRGSADGVCGTLAPPTDHKENQEESDSEINGRHAPGHQAEAGVRRFGVNFCAEFLYESLRDGVFGITPREALVHFLEHGGRDGATNVIALRQNLIAAAHAHELAGDLMSAVGGLLRRQGRARLGQRSRHAKQHREENYT